MMNSFNYKEVPDNYNHCLNAQCPRAGDCLRFIAAQHAGVKIATFRVVNPVYVASRKECPLFHPNQLIRYAVGITHLYENLPYTKVLPIKKQIQAYFQRGKYYRIYRKERNISPEEQCFIRELFRKEGIQEEPAFDEYIDIYRWG